MLLLFVSRPRHGDAPNLERIETSKDGEANIRQRRLFGEACRLGLLILPDGTFEPLGWIGRIRCGTSKKLFRGDLNGEAEAEVQVLWGLRRVRVSRPDSSSDAANANGPAQI